MSYAVREPQDQQQYLMNKDNAMLILHIRISNNILLLLIPSCTTYVLLSVVRTNSGSSIISSDCTCTDSEGWLG